MKELKELLQNIAYFEIAGAENPPIKSLQFNAGQVQPQDLFFAVIAYGIDGHQFIEEAIENGASAIICQKIPPERKKAVVYVRVENALIALSHIAANYYGHPTKKLKMVGVTGTNGKTSTVTLLHQIFRKLGHKTGLLSTIVNKVNDLEMPTHKTTPHATEIQRLCRVMVDAGCEYCFMELSSHGIHQKRVAGVEFAGAVFTNITHDHLDYHGSFEAYLSVKKSYLDSMGPPAFVVCNLDDPHFAEITADVTASLKSVSIKNPDADFYTKILSNQLTGLVIELEGKPIQLTLRAAYNAYNVLSAFTVAALLGQNKADIKKILPELKTVEGRFDHVISKNKIIGIVDYAHTPDALDNLFSTLTSLKTHRLISVIGCAGDRDKEKRPVMARLSYNKSDYLIITADNPRTEDPSQIFNDMLAGIPTDAPHLQVIPDRKEAIRYACTIARPHDIILLAGKGHEKYQDVQGVKHPWDDKAILMTALNIQEDAAVE
ncbi:MAG: UDP-N-acetylmuramoyl-L-alanyl-D-glutamate--2,6-diaminopimelate ligase [Bacteroidota bacterium]